MCKMRSGALLLCCLLVGCTRRDAPGAPTEPSSALLIDDALLVTSPSFSANGPIPTKYTCEGENTSPALAWSEVPAATKSFAVVVEDPDSPDPAAPRQVFVHRVLYNLSANARLIPEGAMSAAAIAGGGRDGTNDYGTARWSGPCPPKGRHRYFYKVFALDTVLPDLGQPTKGELEKAMDGHVVARGEVVGTYEKQR